MKKYLGGFFLLLILVGLDQWTKILSLKYLSNTPGKDIIAGVFRLEYLENRGAAFGIFQGQRSFLLLITIAILAILAYCYYKMPTGRKYIPMQIVFILISSGAIGNMIDRTVRNYVIDFLYFELIDFPVFNIADCYVVIGSFLAVLLILFYYKEEDFMNNPQRGDENDESEH